MIVTSRFFPFALVLAAGLPVLAATWALLLPPVILSSEMTWDLLFNLAGAWHLWFGHVPHIDYHEPVGVLTFLLTEAGFGLLGPSPRAVLAGMAIFAAVLFSLGGIGKIYERRRRREVERARGERDARRDAGPPRFNG